MQIRGIFSATLFSLFLTGSQDLVAEEPSLILVPEMEKPSGILYENARERAKLQVRRDSGDGLQAFRAKVTESWADVTKVDWSALSRNHAEVTRGWKAPPLPGELEGQVVGRDEATGLLYLELRGPRLPARYDIVYRYLFFYSTFDPDSGRLGPIVATIRGWVLE